MKGKQQAGFTLIELVVGVALMVLIISGIAQLFTGLLRHGALGADVIDREQEARWAVDMMAQEMKYAVRFNTGAGSVLDVVGTDSNQALFTRTRYSLGTDITTGNLVLRRQVFIPAASAAAAITTASLATNDIGNASRGFVGATDFAITTTMAGADVNQVQIMYRIRRNAADGNGATAQTIVFPVNDL